MFGVKPVIACGVVTFVTNVPLPVPCINPCGPYSKSKQVPERLVQATLAPDAVIVGSAYLKLIEKTKPVQLESKIISFTKSLKKETCQQ